MATDTLRERADRVAGAHSVAADSPWELIRRLIAPLASLRITVVLFALAIFLVFAGTLAQVDKDIWEVMNIYFRAWIARIPLQVFFPPAFFSGSVPVVPGYIWFPGGFVLGGAMFINLLAAHAIRFKVQASGNRLLTGLGVIAAGIAVTAFIIISGSGGETLQGVPSLGWATIWNLFKLGLVALCVACAYGAVQIEPGRKIERALLITAGSALAVIAAWLVYRGAEVMPSPSSLRILWQLIKASFPAVILLAGCSLVFRKRAGIVVLHAGIGLMMCNELIVHSFHDEAQMRISEGETVNFVEDNRAFELAIVDPAAADKDDVVVVPQSYLQGSTLIENSELPFYVRPVEYMQNSVLVDAAKVEKNLATAGVGQKVVAEPAKATSGTDMDKADAPSLYAELVDKNSGQSLGTYLFPWGLIRPEKITVEGKTYDVTLRYKRIYKDFTVNLIDVRKDDYLGTNTPKNYSSDIRLVDPSRGVDREVKIWMNNPLRFAGETFYQSQWGVDPQTGREHTTLQVVKNVGWMTPYVACMIVTAGLLAQFGITLLRFLRRRDTATEAVGAAIDSKKPKRKKREVPVAPSRLLWIVPCLVILPSMAWIASRARVPSAPSGEINLYEFGELPIVYDGRIKPLDTLARNSLRVISDREYFVDNNGDSQPAIRWLADVIRRPSDAMKYKVFRIYNLDVLDLLGLQRRKYFRYAIDEFKDKIPQLEQQMKLAQELDPDQLSTFQRKVLELGTKLQLYITLSTSFDQLQFPPVDKPEQIIALIQQQNEALSRMKPVLAVPPEGENAEWQPYARAWSMAYLQMNVPQLGGEPNPATISLNTILAAYAKNDVSTFNNAVSDYTVWLEKNPPPEFSEQRTSFEAFFNHFAPFASAQWLYVFAFVCTALAWLGWSGPLNRAAFGLIMFTFVVHTFALIARMYISGRPPVTNLYTTAIFIGWGCVLLGLVFEYLYGLGIGNVLASTTGFATLLIADKLAGDGDTFTVLQAVLDTQFWLATHVVTINFGYATTLVAGVLGIIYVVRGVLTPALSPEVGKELTRMIYGSLCFSIFFSFVGTVLGGLWADDSWGRFWGWDPKENGALLIVLWNALVLHARWGGMVKERGLALLAIAGNIFVSWSWFGVNELGVGLHSYGFTEGVLKALGIFIIAQLILIVIGSLPRHVWWSSRVYPRVGY